jgi:hypothetical protein
MGEGSVMAGILRWHQTARLNCCELTGFSDGHDGNDHVGTADELHKNMLRQDLKRITEA